MYNLRRSKLLLSDIKKKIFDDWLILAVVMVPRASARVPDLVGLSRIFTEEKKEGFLHQRKKVGNYPKVVKMY